MRSSQRRDWSVKFVHSDILQHFNCDMLGQVDEKTGIVGSHLEAQTQTHKKSHHNMSFWDICLKAFLLNTVSSIHPVYKGCASNFPKIAAGC